VSSFTLHSIPRSALCKPRSVRLVIALIVGLSLTLALAQGTNAQQPTICNGGPLPAQAILLPLPSQQPDLRVTGKCTVQPAKDYYYGNVNIYDKGELIFAETKDSRTDLWVSSIIIENGGTMVAGTPATPYGLKGGRLTIHIYGEASPSAIDSNGNRVPADQQGQGVPCQSGTAAVPCGIPKGVWEDNGTNLIPGCVGLDPPSTTCLPGLPAAVKDYFYQYGPLYGDGKVVDSGLDKGKVGYFGYKTLAVSFGGTLALYGYKGASYDPDTDNDHTSSGVSWIRLAEDLVPGADSLTLEKDPKGPGMGRIEARWRADDEIVVTTTDYLPGHSEKLTISDKYSIMGGTKVPLTMTPEVQWPHVGKRFQLATRIAAAAGRLTIDPQLVGDGAETRAAVALLTRSIRIVSEGDGAVVLRTPHIETFDEASARTPCPNAQPPKNGCYYFGAHMVVRQGFEKVQIQGVEFKQMGQGGRLAHYPVHFHMARKTPAGTFVKDSSVNESMTRWYVIHSTQGVTLARNVGWESIGHGYYLEDATETDNNFYSNIGIFARAAVENIQNPRKVPGILAYNRPTNPPSPETAFPNFPYRSDNVHPSVFWITNGWNDFIGNMAAGAGACGAAYWFVPASNSDMPDVGMPMMHMKWSGYAALQMTHTVGEPPIVIPDLGYSGTTPLKSFYKNYATSAMSSFQTTDDAPDCDGFIAAEATFAPPFTSANTLREVKSIAPAPTTDNQKDLYYPHAIGGERRATRCPLVNGQYDCSAVRACANGNKASKYVEQKQCTAVMLDHYTSAFNWANGNVSAVWLRPKWYLLDNSVLSDVQNGALTFITGGDYTHASIIEGYWGLARNSIFIGTTQPDNPKYASNGGPFQNNPLSCDNPVGPPLDGWCLNSAQGISMPLSNFFVNQRFYNIYDGPAYQDSNVFLDIGPSPCPGAPSNSNRGNCMYGSGLALGVRKDPTDPTGKTCYLPNAAIAWKQPNGFIYPPAFHSRNMFFDKVGIRHYVIDPLFQAPAGVTKEQNFGQGGTYLSDATAVEAAYCVFPGNTGVFNGWSGIDRQTELNDDDGSLTGLSNSLQQTTPPMPPNPLKQTISVNDDTYFTAPVETAECSSNLGSNVDPSTACFAPKSTQPAVTAKTSPYDYLITVVAPGCSQNSPPPSKPFGRCDDNPDNGLGGIWSSDCHDDGCYGVPLYRQFLAGADNPETDPNNPSKWTGEWAHWVANGCNTNPRTVQCRWPFIRMAGANIYQRNTLTVNHGTYYLETTVPLATQSPGGEVFTNVTASNLRAYNEFQEGQTYYVFFVYAKQTIKQTYQIYVGTGCNETTSIRAVRGNIDTGPVKFTDNTPLHPTWLTAKCEENISGGKTGILTVTVDFTGQIELEPGPASGLCKPQTFCNATGSSCGCAFDTSDPLAQASSNPQQVVDECQATCSTWAVKDLDCPEAGCLGFAFTLAGFKADGVLTHRPKPKPFPMIAETGKPDWLTLFDRTKTAPDSSTGGQCFYPKLPGTDCPVP